MSAASDPDKKRQPNPVRTKVNNQPEPGREEKGGRVRERERERAGRASVGRPVTLLATLSVAV